MAAESPDSGVGSGGKLAAELRQKANVAESERPRCARDDLRMAAIENNASQKIASQEPFPLIRAHGNIQHSPNKTTSTGVSDHTALPHHDPRELKRQGSATFSTGAAVPRAHRSSSPTKRPAAAILESYQELVRSASETEPARSGGADDAFRGLDFLLQACDILEPGVSGAGPASSSERSAGGSRPGRAVTSRGRRTGRRASDEAEFDYTPGHSSDEDEDYRPARKANGRPARRAASRAAAVTAAVAAAPAGGASGGGPRWERGMVNGPCTNPDCEHPYDSPQWRKGPPSNPILCNACGTRWLRNGTLKPLVPRRGIRYGKARPKGSVKAAAQARAEAAAARAARREAAAEAELASGHRHKVHTAEDTEFDMAEAENVEIVDPEPHAAPAMAMPAGVLDPQALMEAMAAAAPALFAAAQGVPAAEATAALQQQLAAMTAAAQAAQAAFLAAAQQQQAAAAVAVDTGDKAMEGKAARPVINIQAVAAPQVVAPRAPTEGDDAMQEDAV